jgi:ribosome-associated translation inhibitor RaiA
MQSRVARHGDSNGEKHMTYTMLFSKLKESRGLSLRLTTVSIGRHVGSAVAGLLILTACASVQTPPTAELQAAEMAIATAERGRVADYASVELSKARDKLTAARSAVQQEKMNQALRLAQQARVDAELASARAEVAKAEAVNEEMQKSIDTLKLEMQRNTGDRQ